MNPKKSGCGFGCGLSRYGCGYYIIPRTWHAGKSTITATLNNSRVLWEQDVAVSNTTSRNGNGCYDCGS